MKLCNICNELKDLSKFYSIDKKISSKYSRCRSCFNKYCRNRWVIKKIYYLQVVGECKCSNCGYAENYAALHFHHIDPTLKLMNWTQMRERTDKIILKELENCIVLCANCHAEHHNPQAHFQNIDTSIFDPTTRIPKLKTPLEKKHSPRIKAVKELRECSKCSIPISKKAITCYACRDNKHNEGKTKFTITKEELQKLVEEYSMVEIGKLFGVSDNAVKKRCKKLEIDFSNRKCKTRNNSKLFRKG